MLAKILLTMLLPVLSTAGVSSSAVKGVSIKNIPGWNKTNTYAIEPLITARSAVVLDAETGSVLYEKNINEQRPIASITKIVTAYAYITQKNYSPDTTIQFLNSDLRNGGRRNLYSGEFGTASDFLHLALVGSDNSAAAALARSAGFTDNFEETANQTLRSLNLKSSRFVEPTGLNADNVSTALEIATIARKVFAKEEISAITTQKEYIFSPLYSSKKRKVTTTNDLLSTKLFTIKAGKTGSTKEAGYCLTIKAENKFGKDIIIAVLGAPTDKDRFQDAKTLAWWVFENFK